VKLSDLKPKNEAVINVCKTCPNPCDTVNADRTLCPRLVDFYIAHAVVEMAVKYGIKNTFYRDMCANPETASIATKYGEWCALLAEARKVVEG
jgi:hypothetical protein